MHRENIGFIECARIDALKSTLSFTSAAYSSPFTRSTHGAEQRLI
jgi:hypothetical protein